MSKHLKTAALLLTLACTLQLHAQSAADEAAVYAILDEGNAAFTARDADRFAAVFTENADFIPPVGTVVHGREAIRQAHVELFKFLPKPGEITREKMDGKVRFLTPDLALLTVQMKFTETVDGKTMTDAMTFSLVTRRSGSKWLAELVTLTPEQPVPAGK